MLLSTLPTVQSDKPWVELGVVCGWSEDGYPAQEDALDDMVSVAKTKYKHKLGGIIGIQTNTTWNPETKCFMVTAHGTAIRIYN